MFFEIWGLSLDKLNNNIYYIYTEKYCTLSYFLISDEFLAVGGVRSVPLPVFLVVMGLIRLAVTLASAFPPSRSVSIHLSIASFFLLPHREGGTGDEPNSVRQTSGACPTIRETIG